MSHCSVVCKSDVIHGPITLYWAYYFISVFIWNFLSMLVKFLTLYRIFNLVNKRYRHPRFSVRKSSAVSSGIAEVKTQPRHGRQTAQDVATSVVSWTLTSGHPTTMQLSVPADQLVSIDVVLGRPNGVYRPGDRLTGHVTIDAKQDIPLCGMFYLTNF